MSEFFIEHTTLGQYADLEPTHVEEQVGVILAVDRHKAILPLNGSDGTRKTILDLPEYSTTTSTQVTLINQTVFQFYSQVNIMFH